jgi:hypothetical protein
MFTKRSDRSAHKPVLVCLLLLAVLFCISIVAAAHVHKGPVHDSQCTVCMVCAQMVGVCAAVVALLLFTIEEREPEFEREQKLYVTWVPLAQRVRPPPSY